VLYALRAFVFDDAVRDNEALAGGCFIGPDDPEWHCRVCGRDW